MKWTTAELKKLSKLYNQKPNWVTDYEYSATLSGVFHKSPESIRWQMRQFHRTATADFAKILLLDIETLPLEAYVWGTRKQFIQPHAVQKDWSIVCWTAKWLFGSEFYGEVVKPQSAINRTDKEIMGGMWNLLDEANLVITQNGDQFDLKKLNTRFLVNGMLRPSQYTSIDTYRVLTQNFDFTFNKLDWVASVLGIGRKVETSFKWWDECAQGNKVYLDKMLEYNKYDVALLEELYLKLRPWMTNHPNVNLYSSQARSDKCKTCGSLNLEWSNKYTTAAGLYKGWRCQDCGSLGRDTIKKNRIL